MIKVLKNIVITEREIEIIYCAVRQTIVFLGDKIILLVKPAESAI